MSSDNEYEIEKLIDHRKNTTTGQDEYLIKWKNYPASENSWEPESNLSAMALEEARKFKEDDDRNHDTAGEAVKNTINYPIIKLIPLNQAQCASALSIDLDNVTFASNGETHQIPPEVARKIRSTMCLKLCSEVDDIVDVNDNIHNRPEPTQYASIDKYGNYSCELTLGRCEFSGISWQKISRSLCDIGMTRVKNNNNNNNSKDDDVTVWIKMRKGVDQHEVHLDGKLLAQPIGQRFPIHDNSIISFWGATGFSYRIKIESNGAVLRKFKEDDDGNHDTAGEAVKNTINYPIIKLIPLNQAQCASALSIDLDNVTFASNGETHQIPPEVARKIRSTMCLKLCSEVDDIVDVNDNIHNRPEPTQYASIDKYGNYSCELTLGRCEFSGISWQKISRSLCDIGMTRVKNNNNNNNSKDDDVTVWIKMRKGVDQHEVHLDGKLLAQPIGQRFPIHDNSIISFWGATGFSYRIKIESNGAVINRGESVASVKKSDSRCINVTSPPEKSTRKRPANGP